MATTKTSSKVKRDKASRSERRSLLHEVSALHVQGLGMAEACHLVGIKVSVNDRLPSKTPFVPTPSMIRAKAIEIQKTWSAYERRQRQVYRAPRCELKVFDLKQLG